MAFSGLILAGGLSRRMQGSSPTTVDKGLICLDGRPLVAHVHRYMLGQGAHPVLVSANRNGDHYASYGDVIPDSPGEQGPQGPLHGIAAALEVVRTPWLFVLPVDALGLPADLASRLASEAAESRSAYAVSEDGPQPLCMMVHRSCRASLAVFLEQGGRKVQDWLASLAAAPVFFGRGEGRFLNINTPADLDQVRSKPRCPCI